VLRVSGSRREEYGWTYPSDDDLPALVVDGKHQMAKFWHKTLMICSGLVVLTYCTLGQKVLLLSLER